MPIKISIGHKTSALPARTSTSEAFRPSTINGTPSRSALRHDSDDSDEAAPKHEAIIGFSEHGVVASEPVQSKQALVIESAGNADWRRRGRGKNLLPTSVQTNTNETVTVEKDEVQTVGGLHITEKTESVQQNRHTTAEKTTIVLEPGKPLTDDERALKALLNDGKGEPTSNTVIHQAGNERLSAADETDDFRADVAARPDSCTLEEYAAMPVEEFGMAMLRGMGKKRRANGEVITLDTGNEDKKKPATIPRQGYLGIGAKAAPGAEAELGAWGKADMRKNKKGEGLYTPVMLKDKRTGELITEEELERRKKDAKEKSKNGDNDWRERRDRNLERSGRDMKDGEPKYLTDKGDHVDRMGDFSRNSSSGRDRNGYDSPRSRREKSRSPERRRHDDRNHDDRDRERRREQYRDEGGHRSGSSRSSHRDGRSRRDGP